MSKIIKVTAELIAQLAKEFVDSISNDKMQDGKVEFSKTLGAVDRKATLFFEEKAWIKMQSLIREFDKEVAWHGIAYRGDNSEKDEYVISDILVYPQEVTSATVDTDQKKYEEWLMRLDDDEFNNLRMQGHSHVNMGVTPSTVDTNHQKKILDQLDDSMFYVFLIWNKKGDRTVKIYDMSKNILFENKDVDVKIIEEQNGFESFLRNAKEMVKTKTYAPTHLASSSTSAGKQTDNKKPVSENKPSEDKSDDKSSPKSDTKKGRKGKRKKHGDSSKNDSESKSGSGGCYGGHSYYGGYGFGYNYDDDYDWRYYQT